MQPPQDDLAIQKKWSMGKYLRKQKQLYNPEPEFSYLKQTPLQNNLLSYMKSKGFISSKVAIGEFSLKNGLRYTGLIVTEDLLTHEVFLQLPKQLVLNTRTAYLSEINIVFQENKDDFIYNNEICDDYLLLFFILFEYQKGKESEWFNYISTFPKDQGFLALWTEKDLELLEEDCLKKKSEKYYKEILEEFERLCKIAMKYPDFFKKDTFSLQNFLWIYSILTNRSFFSGYKYVTMMPFVDMLNHECVNVYPYQVLNDKEKQEEIFTDHKKFTNEEMDNFSSSEETWGEKDDDEFDEFHWENPEEKEMISENLLIKNVVDWFQKKLNFEDLTSITFLGRLIAFIEENQTENADFSEKIMLILEDYLKNLIEFYANSLKIEYKKNICEEKKIENNNSDPFKIEWEPENYEEIKFITNDNENYAKNSQIYLCYGQNSNKRLIKHYGISIEYNKYDKVFLNILPSNFYKESNIFSKFLLQRKCSPFVKQFKLKYTILDTKLIVFFKMLTFDFEKNQIDEIFHAKNIELEIKAIEKTMDFLKGLNFSKNSLEENEKMLFDRNIGYNHYFSVVYKLEKQRITQLHIKLLNICLIMFQKIQKGLNKFQVFAQKIDSLENEEEFGRHRYLLSPYMKKWEF